MWFTFDFVLALIHDREEKNGKGILTKRRPQARAMAVLFLLIYLPMRLCILVEPLVGMRSLPLVAFDTVGWTLFIPHI